MMDEREIAAAKNRQQIAKRQETAIQPCAAWYKLKRTLERSKISPRPFMRHELRQAAPKTREEGRTCTVRTQLSINVVEGRKR